MATEKNPFVYEEEESFIEPEPSEGVEVLSDGSVEVMIEEEEEEAEAPEIDFMANLAENLSKDVLEEIGSNAIRMYTDDKEARSEWEQMFEDGFDLLGLKLNEAADPFEGACTAVHPLLIESAVKFQSKASGETLPIFRSYSYTNHRGDHTRERTTGNSCSGIYEFRDYRSYA